MRKIVSAVFLCLLAFFFVSIYYYVRWSPLWSLESPKPCYAVNFHQDDTLRIAMIGDSWVGMRTDSMNIFFQSRLSKLIEKPVVLRSSGKGGERTKGIYQLLFESGKYGLKPLIMDGVNYCVIIAGINDAAANIGTQQYCHYYSQILYFLLECKIRPIVIEIPNVDIWHIYGGKPVKDYLSDYVKSLMTGCKMYNYENYREALWDMLHELRLIDKVLFVKMDSWNNGSPEIDYRLFLEDRIHLNSIGYEKLDNSIAEVIAENL